MKYSFTLNEFEIEHLREVLEEDGKRRMKSIRNAGTYISDEQVQERIQKYMVTMELLNTKIVKEGEDEPAPEVPINDFFRI